VFLCRFLLCGVFWVCFGFLLVVGAGGGGGRGPEAVLRCGRCASMLSSSGTGGGGSKDSSSRAGPAPTFWVVAVAESAAWAATSEALWPAACPPPVTCSRAVWGIAAASQHQQQQHTARAHDHKQRAVWVQTTCRRPEQGNAGACVPSMRPAFCSIGGGGALALFTVARMVWATRSFKEAWSSPAGWHAPLLRASGACWGSQARLTPRLLLRGVGGRWRAASAMTSPTHLSPPERGLGAAAPPPWSPGWRSAWQPLGACRQGLAQHAWRLLQRVVARSRLGWRMALAARRRAHRPAQRRPAHLVRHGSFTCHSQRAQRQQEACLHPCRSIPAVRSFRGCVARAVCCQLRS